MVIRRGEIWWADLPIPSGSESGYRRPVLIIQDDHLNKSNLETVIIVPLTRNIERLGIATNVLLPKGETGLPEDSVAITHLIVARSKRVLRERVGKLPSRLMDEVEIALLTSLGIVL